MANLLRTVTVTAAAGAGVVGGVFLAFSTFVMKAIDEQPAPQAVSTMQALNRHAPNPLFMVALLGTGAAAAGLAVAGVVRHGEPGSGWLVAGGGLYLAGLAVTIVYHVPRNDALALVDPNALSAATTWADYYGGWIGWNHVRTATSIAGTVAFCLAL